MEKKLLIDFFGILKPTLSENADGTFVAKGEFGFAGVPTENKRIYPKGLWEREIQRIRQALAEGKVLGELDHPADGKTSLKRVSHVMTDLEMTEDGRIIGTAKICKNAYGDQLRSIREAGGAIGVSSRGMGSTAMNEDGYEVVQEDYQYITHDFVSDPAVRSSYPKFSTESKEIKKETVMETKVESKKEETKPEVKTEAKAEAPTTKVEEAKQPEAKPIDQLAQEMTDRLAAQKKDLEEAHAKEVASLRESITKELSTDPKVVAGKIVLEDVAKLLRPVLLPEDVQEVVKAKDKEIAELTAKVESVKTEKKAIEEQHAKTAKVAHEFGMLYHFEKALTESDNRKAIRGIIGDPKKYAKHEDLTLAVEGAREALKAVVESKKTDDTELKALKEGFEKQIADLKAENTKTKSALDESAKLARQFGIKAYVLEKTKGNPNAAKILALTEGAKNKAEADAFIEKFGVAAPISEEYNSIRNRFRKIEKTNLVENQLKDSGLANKGAESSTDVVTESVEREMDGLFLGSTLDQVKDLGQMPKN